MRNILIFIILTCVVAFGATERKQGNLIVTGNLGAGTPSGSNAFEVRKDQNSTTRGLIVNGSSGASAAAKFTVSGADDLDFIGNGAAAGAISQINSGSGFTNGLRISQLGNRPIELWTNGSKGFSLLGSGASQFFGSVSITGSGPSLTIQDTAGVMGTNSAPKINLKDSSSTVGVIGFLNATDYTITFRNYSSVGSFAWVINATQYLGIDQNGVIAAAGRMDLSGGVTLNPNSVSLTADNQAVSTTGKSFLQISSDNATAANRTFTLGVPVAGQVLVLEWTHATNRGELLDDSSDGLGSVRLSADWRPDQYDTLTLIGTGAGDWIETARSAN